MIDVVTTELSHYLFTHKEKYMRKLGNVTLSKTFSVKIKT